MHGSFTCSSWQVATAKSKSDAVVKINIKGFQKHIKGRKLFVRAVVHYSTAL